MFITIAGDLGSGKSTVAKILNKGNNFDYYSTGEIQREITKEKGVSTLELNQQMTTDKSNPYDDLIDNKTIEIAHKNSGKDIVFDSRMAWHFVDNSFKVYITVDPYVAAERMMNAHRGIEEQYTSIDEAVAGLQKRKQLENERFANIYSVNISDFDNYDLVLDSTCTTPKELAMQILKGATDNAV